jgi:hypothetical protein
MFAGLTGLLLPSYSREVLRSGPRVEALRQAAAQAVADCRKVLKDPIP